METCAFGTLNNVMAVGINVLMEVWNSEGLGISKYENLGILSFGCLNSLEV